MASNATTRASRRPIVCIELISNHEKDCRQPGIPTASWRGRAATKLVIPSVGTPACGRPPWEKINAGHVILRRGDAEGSQNAKLSHFEILRRADAGSGGRDHDPKIHRRA